MYAEQQVCAAFVGIEQCSESCRTEPQNAVVFGYVVVVHQAFDQRGCFFGKGVLHPKAVEYVDGKTFAGCLPPAVGKRCGVGAQTFVFGEIVAHKAAECFFRTQLLVAYLREIKRVVIDGTTLYIESVA